jgi:hypothetical protein
MERTVANPQATVESSSDSEAHFYEPPLSAFATPIKPPLDLTEPGIRQGAFAQGEMPAGGLLGGEPLGGGLLGA